jgi:hypothetical protein
LGAERKRGSKIHGTRATEKEKKNQEGEIHGKKKIIYHLYVITLLLYYFVLHD